MKTNKIITPISHHVEYILHRTNGLQLTSLYVDSLILKILEYFFIFCRMVTSSLMTSELKTNWLGYTIKRTHLSEHRRLFSDDQNQSQNG